MGPLHSSHIPTTATFTLSHRWLFIESLHCIFNSPSDIYFWPLSYFMKEITRIEKNFVLIYNSLDELGETLKKVSFKTVKPHLTLFWQLDFSILITWVSPFLILGISGGCFYFDSTVIVFNFAGTKVHGFEVFSIFTSTKVRRFVMSSYCSFIKTSWLLVFTFTHLCWLRKTPKKFL